MNKVITINSFKRNLNKRDNYEGTKDRYNDEVEGNLETENTKKII